MLLLLVYLIYRINRGNKWHNEKEKINKIQFSEYQWKPMKYENYSILFPSQTDFFSPENYLFSYKILQLNSNDIGLVNK